MKIPTAKEVLSKHPQKITQLQLIKGHLSTYGSITNIEAINLYGITRASQYIMILRNQYNYNIDTVWVNEGTMRFGKKNKRYGIYKLKSI